jgi:hypothetical protein
MSWCSKCGKRLKVVDIECPRCGTEIPKEDTLQDLIFKQATDGLNNEEVALLDKIINDLKNDK